ncbi:L,D-transpeptidase [Aquibium sp. ELW1220]|uniref:L,D-transpeptidase n=1 Tax=Aquibium sp. ELW1220 TaxID=2976766 RepID=UPI0025AF26D7|nr:L,D-transpeptidase [Aquibium sp. ELW1220]MDN2581409.1 L,D-transpeptidase [Aquibium sp. ELW1220]
MPPARPERTGCPAARPSGVDRRAFVAMLLSFAAAGCASDGADGELLEVDYPRPVFEEAHFVPGVPSGVLRRKHRRQIVAYPTAEQQGTVVVDTGTRFLYLVHPGGRAIRYGIGIGRDGFLWKGRAIVGAKREWPTWTPPPEMIARDPRLGALGGAAGGMAGGTDNPLGARALYLHRDGRDTLYRIHGTTDAGSIGSDVTSGCVRMLNIDVIDLYRRVPQGATVVVL